MAISLLLALCIGVVMGLTGAGGGIFAIPSLVIGMGWTPQQAAPVALLAVAGSATFGAVEAWCNGLVRYRAACVMAVAGIPTVAIGAFFAQRLPPMLLTLLFSAVMLVAAWRLLSTSAAANQPLYPATLHQQSGRFIWRINTWLLFLALGAFTGFMTGLLAVGGGFILVPLLRRCVPLSLHSCIATSLMVIALVSSSAIITAVMQGARLPVPFVFWFVLGTVTGVFIGRKLSQYLSEDRVQQGFAWLLILVAMGMLCKTLAGYAS